VIRLAHRHDVGATRRGHRDADGEIGCLRAGVDEEHRVEFVGQRGGDPFGELGDRAVVEPGVGVQEAHLPVSRLDHPGVGVPDGGDVVDHVEVDAAVDVGEELPPSALDAWRVGVVVLLHVGQHPLAQDEGVVLGLGTRRRQAEARSGIAGEGLPAAGVGPLHPKRHVVDVRSGELHVDRGARRQLPPVPSGTLEAGEPHGVLGGDDRDAACG
jgi:hypothetical protein